MPVGADGRNASATGRHLSPSRSDNLAPWFVRLISDAPVPRDRGRSGPPNRHETADCPAPDHSTCRIPAVQRPRETGFFSRSPANGKQGAGILRSSSGTEKTGDHGREDGGAGADHRVWTNGTECRTRTLCRSESAKGPH